MRNSGYDFCQRTGWLALLLLAVALSSCVKVDSYFVVGDRQQRQRLRELLRYHEQPYLSAQASLTLYELISAELVDAGYPERMRNFLMLHVEQDIDNIYNAYYLYLIATSYLLSNQKDMARYYLHRIIWNHNDVEIEHESIHQKSLMALIEIEDDERRRAAFLEELLERFPDVDHDPSRYLQLAHSYGRIQKWQETFDSYQQLVNLCTVDSNGCFDLPNGSDVPTIAANLRFWQSARDWSVEELDDLVSSIKGALSTKDVGTLLRYRPSVNFFARSWEQVEFDFNSQINFNIGIFLRRSQVSYSDAIDINSNAQEAYLRTWGWSYRIPTWYFYFRKVDFPADPTIHGNWEWAGIFFGEQL